MRYVTRLLLAALALSIAGPASAQFWTITGNCGVATYKINNATGENMTGHFCYRPSNGTPTWSLSATDNDNSSKEFESREQTWRGGQTLGGAYKAPTFVGTGGVISLKWFSATDGDLTDFVRAEIGTLRLANAATQPITRTLIAPNLQAPGAGYHPNSIWWNPSQGGTGWFTEHQGDYFFATVFTYAANGDDEWYFTSGAMTSTTNYNGELRRCVKADSVTCPSLGVVSMTFRTIGANPNNLRYFIDVVLPNGATTTLERFLF